MINDTIMKHLNILWSEKKTKKAKKKIILALGEDGLGKMRRLL